MAEREVLLAAVRDVLERVATSENLSTVLEADALDAARQLAGMLRDDDGDLNARYLLGWLHWYRYQALPEGQDRADLVAAIEALAPCSIAGAGELPTALRPVLADHAVPVATELMRDARILAEPELTAARADLWQRIVAATPNDHPGRAARLSNMGIAIQAKFKQTRALLDADAAISAAQEAVEATPAEHPDHAGMVTNLGLALQARFDCTGELADLDAAIEAQQTAVAAAPPGHPE